MRTYDEICQLLTVTPESNAGLFYLSLGLFHPMKRTRRATAELLERIMGHEAGRHFWAQLGRFAKVGFWRMKREMEGTGESPANVGMDARVRGGR